MVVLVLLKPSMLLRKHKLKRFKTCISKSKVSVVWQNLFFGGKNRYLGTTYEIFNLYKNVCMTPIKQSPNSTFHNKQQTISKSKKNQKTIKSQTTHNGYKPSLAFCNVKKDHILKSLRTCSCWKKRTKVTNVPTRIKNNKQNTTQN